jgi:hypothetical protein
VHAERKIMGAIAMAGKIFKLKRFVLVIGFLVVSRKNVDRELENYSGTDLRPILF